jgi:hypothetical protein
MNVSQSCRMCRIQREIRKRRTTYNIVQLLIAALESTVYLKYKSLSEYTDYTLLF